MFKKFQADLKRIFIWQQNAFLKLREMQTSTTPDKDKQIELTADIFRVMNSFFDATKNIIPNDGSFTPFPKSLWSQIKWVGQNIQPILFFAALDKLDPFAAVRADAQEVAHKWGWAF